MKISVSVSTLASAISMASLCICDDTEVALADDSDSPLFLFGIFFFGGAYQFSIAAVISALHSGVPAWGPLIAIIGRP